MTNPTTRTAATFLVALAAAAALGGCRATTHPVAPSDLGRPASSDALVALLERLAGTSGPMPAVE